MKDEDQNQYVWPEPAKDLGKPKAALSHSEGADPTLLSPSQQPPPLSKAEQAEEPKPQPVTIAAPPLPAAPKPGSIIFDKYELISLIASGGMGQVYRGRHLQLRMPLAIKIMHDFIAANPEHTERFRREALALSKLSHPNVVRVIDFGKLESTLFLVMEYIDGESLSAFIRRQTSPIALRSIYALLIQILDALIALHDQGIIHRDLKPHNILLTTNGEGEQIAKVADLGLARYRDAEANDVTLTQADAVAGTPAYMSPEQCRSLRVTHSTDLYAFGCILTELLQRKPPFVGGSVADTISMHLFAPVKPLQRPPAAEPIPPGLEQLRRELLAKSPNERPCDARATRARLLSAISTIDGGEMGEIRGTKGRDITREQRLPDWNRAAPTSLPRTPGNAHRVGLLTLPEPPHALDEACITGLVAQGICLDQVETPGEMAGLDAVILDCGNNATLAVSWTRRVRNLHANLRILVVVIGLNSGLLNELVEAGADDVTRGSVTSDVLGRKLSRLVGKRQAPS